MTDTDPTPERRWTLEAPPYGRFELDGTPQFAHTVLATLNEAETLRAERDEMRRVIDEINEGAWGLSEIHEATKKWRALAGAETEAGR